MIRKYHTSQRERAIYIDFNKLIQKLYHVLVKEMVLYGISVD